jgi:hypothetical protein
MICNITTWFICRICHVLTSVRAEHIPTGVIIITSIQIIPTAIGPCGYELRGEVDHLIGRRENGARGGADDVLRRGIYRGAFLRAPVLPRGATDFPRELASTS